MSQLLSDTAKNRQIGIALVTVTTLMFATLDTSAKWLVQSVPVLQVVWLRFLFHTILTTAIFMPSMGKQLFSIQNPRLQLLRGVMLAIMTGLNFFALQYLQLAEVGAVQFSVPLLIALISAWFLHEKLDAQRWWAIGLGFVGVLVIIRPGSQGFHPAIFLSIVNAFIYAAFNLMTRRLASSDHPIAFLSPALQWIESSLQISYLHWSLQGKQGAARQPAQLGDGGLARPPLQLSQATH